MNIIFDLGGVVLTWKPRELVNAHFSIPSEQEKVYTEAYRHSDWLDLDRGTLSMDAAVENAVLRTGCSREALTAFYRAVPDFLVPISATLALMDRVKQAGHPMFVLSNMHDNSIRSLEENHKFFDLFDGGVISCRVKMIKPDPEIYRLLLKKYNLKAEDSLFIDDTPENVIAARALGMRAVLFRDAADCERKLSAENVF